MPAAELQETGRIPPNAHHSMPEDGCRPCSGLDPPMIKKVGAPCRRRPEDRFFASVLQPLAPAALPFDAAPAALVPYAGG